jgi:hypothetical protein
MWCNSTKKQNQVTLRKFTYLMNTILPVIEINKKKILPKDIKSD